ncbi:MAG: GNAT family N-acetyltransferase, partial [Solirubrobacteraceae bacterium]
KDEAQIRWLWQPGEREAWRAMTPDAQREHGRQVLQRSRDAFGSGPKWAFSVDTAAARCVAYVDCDLANAHVPAGEANISYAAHPDARGRGYVSRAVRLVLRFLAEHTAARRADLIVDAENYASLRVARSVGAVEVERWINERDREMVRHSLGTASAVGLPPS